MDITSKPIDNGYIEIPIENDNIEYLYKITNDNQQLIKTTETLTDGRIYKYFNNTLNPLSQLVENTNYKYIDGNFIPISKVISSPIAISSDSPIINVISRTISEVGQISRSSMIVIAISVIFLIIVVVFIITQFTSCKWSWPKSGQTYHTFWPIF